jgi:hypothetical protein
MKPAARRVCYRLPAVEPADQRGFILPFVILATLAITSLALAAFTLARAEHRAAEWERGRLATLADLGGSEGSLNVVAALGAGYRVVGVAEDSRVDEDLPRSFLSPLRLHRVAWCLDPDEEAEGGWWSSESPARLGPLRPSALVDLLLRAPGVLAGGEVVLPGGAEGDSIRVWGGSDRVGALPGSGGTFLVVADGALGLTGEGTLAAVLIAAGDVVIGEGVEMAGGIRAGGEILSSVGGATGPFVQAEDLASRVLRGQALRALPSCPRLLWEGGRLGYF